MSNKYQLMTATFTCLIIFINSMNISADETSSASTKTIEQLVEDLDSRDFKTRQTATRQLMKAGEKSVAPLTKAAQSSSLEVAVRAVSILEKMYLSKVEAHVDPAELALETLSASTSRSVASRAFSVLETHYDLREQRAIVKIKSHGGQINYLNNQLRTVNPPQQTIPKQISYVLLGMEWKGDDGLKYVKRLTKLPTLYIIKGAKVSDEGRKDLKLALPNLIIQDRGRAYLGIAAFAHPQGCQVSLVKGDTAAEKAGVQPGDIITKFDKKAINNFDALIEMIATRKPGDKIKMEILRLGEKKMLTVVLDEWK